MSTTGNPEGALIYRTLIESRREILEILGSLANESRLLVLTSALKKPQTFMELQVVTRLGKTALSNHLGMLVKSGLLRHTGKGQYEASADGMEFLKSFAVVYEGSKRKAELESARRADYIMRTHMKEGGKLVREMDVKIVKLKPMQVASVCAVSRSPEHDAWEKMRLWAEPRGLLKDPDKHPVYGFNNPDAKPSNGKYGYEFWMCVERGTKPSEDMKIKKVPGGLYAVTTCRLKEELESEFFKKNGCLESWKKLRDWVKSSKYKTGKHQCLEKAHEPGAPDDELVLDLYYPLE